LKCIFLDRDGTLIVDHGYTYKLEDLEIIPRVSEALQLLCENGFKLIVVTNQSGLHRKIFSLEQMNEFHEALKTRLQKDGIRLHAIYHSPFLPEENSPLRKPQTGMIDQASQDFPVDRKFSWVVGDQMVDVGLANKSGLPGILLLTGSPLDRIGLLQEIRPDFVAKDMLQAAEFILNDNWESKFVPNDQLKARLDSIRKAKQIVSLNGSFDILHEGHRKIIQEAKVQGDFLIVALNSDKSIHRYKGKLRPLNSETARLRMMANFAEVDAVCLFDEDTPIEVLEKIQPSVHVNGSEYGENCIEAPTVRKFGGRIHIVRLEDGFSTTNLLKNKFKDLAH